MLAIGGAAAGKWPHAWPGLMACAAGLAAIAPRDRSMGGDEAAAGRSDASTAPAHRAAVTAPAKLLTVQEANLRTRARDETQQADDCYR